MVYVRIDGREDRIAIGDLVDNYFYLDHISEIFQDAFLSHYAIQHFDEITVENIDAHYIACIWEIVSHDMKMLTAVNNDVKELTSKMRKSVLMNKRIIYGIINMFHNSTPADTEEVQTILCNDAFLQLFEHLSSSYQAIILNAIQRLHIAHPLLEEFQTTFQLPNQNSVHPMYL